MKLIIDIPEEVYKRTVFYREFKDLNDCVDSVKAIVNGTPFDDVKAEIEAKSDSIPWRYIQYDDGWIDALEWVLGILDNIGKAESEDKE